MIKVTAPNGKTASCTVTVNETKPVPVAKKDQPVKQAGGITVNVDTKTDGTAIISQVKKTNKKKIAISDTVVVGGVAYKVTTVDKNAFRSCKKMTTLTIPSTVKLIKKGAFTGAKNLKVVKFTCKTVPTIKKGAFKGLNTKKMIIQVTKAMSKKNFKKFQQALKKAGFKGKIIYVKK